MGNHRLTCSEIWGGIKNDDIALESSSVKASLFSSSHAGGKGGDIYYLSLCSNDVITRLAIADVLGHGNTVSEVSQWLFDSLKAHMNDIGEDMIMKDVNRIASSRGPSSRVYMQA